MKAKERLFAYLKPMRKSLVLAVIFALLFVVAQIGQPFLLGRALDAEQKELYIYVFVALGLIIAGAIFAYIFEVTVMNVAQKIIKKARDEVYEKINSISIKDFDQKTHGDLVLLEIRDMENLSAGLFAVFKTLIQGIFTIIVTIIMMLVVNWILALGVIVLSPLSMIMAKLIASATHKHYKKQSELQAEVSSISLETLNNIDVVQSLNYEDKSIELFDKSNKKLQKEARFAQFSACWVNPSTRLVNNTIYILIGVIGVVMLSYDAKLAAVFAVMTIGRLSSFLSYTNQYSKPFNEISNVAAEYENAKASFNRINNFLNLKNDVNERKYCQNRDYRIQEYVLLIS